MKRTDPFTAADPVWDIVETANALTPEYLDAFQKLPGLAPNDPRPFLAAKTSTEAVWKVPIKGPVDAFMAIRRTNYLNDQTFVVFVRSREFYSVWRSIEALKDRETPNRPPPLDEIPADRKWSWQAQCWSHGQSNPVPLASVSYDARFGIGFVDGITRTLWLINHRAASFPVSVHRKSVADALHQIVGDPLQPPISVADLLGIEREN